MTVLPPGLIAPPDPTRVVVPLERRAIPAPGAGPRWNRWSIAFVALASLTVLALVLAAVDLLNG